MGVTNKLMDCVASLFSTRRLGKWSKKSVMVDVIRCKQAEQTGDYKKAYELLLKIVGKTLYGAHPMSRDHRFTMIYNIPIECLYELGCDIEKFAVAAIYNLYWTGFPTPGGFARVLNNKFTLRTDAGHEHLGELLIISKEEYEDPLKFRPELRCSFEQPFLHSESSIRFYSGSEDIVVRYKTLERRSKHSRVYLECEGHYYEYSWQFCLG